MISSVMVTAVSVRSRFVGRVEIERQRVGLALMAGVVVALASLSAAKAGQVTALGPPLSFEPNRGQVDGRVWYVSRGPGFDVFVGAEGVVLKPHRLGARPGAWRFRGAAAKQRCEGTDRLPGVSNYLLGLDPERWVAGVPHYAQVRCRELYPGVDVVYYWRGRELEYDLLVRPGADPRGIQLEFAGGGCPRVEPNGDLTVEGSGMRFRRPVSRQPGRSGRRQVEAEYTVAADGSVGFEVSGYERSQALLIDPVVVFSTYLGGPAAPSWWLSGSAPVAMTVDGRGNVYVAGRTSSLEFPTTPWSPQPHPPAEPRLAEFPVVSKLSQDGSKLLFSTYLAGIELFIGISGLAVDEFGRIHIAGSPISLSGPGALVITLDPSGSRVLNSTRLAGSKDDRIAAITLGPSGDVYVAGSTDSPDFPVTPAAYQRALAGERDVFVVRLSPGGAIRYSTYVGGAGREGYDERIDIAVDAEGNAYVTGQTSDSTGFPKTPGALDEEVGNRLNKVFVFKLNAAGTELMYSAVFGGQEFDLPFGIAVDATGAAYVTGRTSSFLFPVTEGAFQTAPPRGGPLHGISRHPREEFGVFLSKLSPSGDRFIYSTFLGGENATGWDIAVDAGGRAWIAGAYESREAFPLRNPLQTEFREGDAFLSVLNETGSDLVLSTLLGGSGADGATAMAFGPAGTVYIAGFTMSTDFPTTAGALQAAAPQAIENMFVVRIDPTATPLIDGSGLVNAASLRPGPVAPGEIVSLFGAGVGPLNASQSAPTPAGFLPTELGKTRLLFDGIAAPLLFVSAGQVNTIAPFALAGKSSTRIQVEFAGARSNVVELPVAKQMPAIFTLDASGSGPAAALNEDGTLNSTERPAPAGSVIVLYLTGGGQTVPPGIDGRVAETGPPWPAPALPVEVTIGGRAAEVEYAGQAPGLVHGVWQINARISPEVSGDSVPVAVQIENSTTPPGVTIAVRPR